MVSRATMISLSSGLHSSQDASDIVADRPQKMCSICGGGIEPGTKYMMIAVGNPRKSQKHEPAHPQCAFDLQSKMGR